MDVLRATKCKEHKNILSKEHVVLSWGISLCKHHWPNVKRTLIIWGAWCRFSRTEFFSATLRTIFFGDPLNDFFLFPTSPPMINGRCLIHYVHSFPTHLGWFTIKSIFFVPFPQARFKIKLKADRPHSQDYPHKQPDHTHTYNKVPTGQLDLNSLTFRSMFPWLSLTSRHRSDEYHTLRKKFCFRIF